jgi:hypothetical protein
MLCSKVNVKLRKQQQPQQQQQQQQQQQEKYKIIYLKDGRGESLTLRVLLTCC